MSSLRMLDDRVAVIPVEDPDTYGSIIIPDVAKKRPDQGVVYSIGPEVVDLKVGDHVLFSAYSGTQVALVDIGTLIIMPEDAVVAWLTDDEYQPLLPRDLVLRTIDDALAHHETTTGYQLDSGLRNTLRGMISNLSITKGFEY